MNENKANVFFHSWGLHLLKHTYEFSLRLIAAHGPLIRGDAPSAHFHVRLQQSQSGFLRHGTDA